MQKDLTESNRVKPAPNLTEQVTAMLKRQITGGVYEKGDILPSEQSLATNFGVSRAVIREAVSRLKGDGLVITRQGRGATVVSTIGQQTFQIAGDSAGNRDGIHNILELRMCLEVEAAGLAAERRTGKHLQEMEKALAALVKAVSDGSLTRGVKADLRFHEIICVATMNPHFLGFFNFLSPFLAKALTITRRNSMERGRRIEDVEAEHKHIYTAIKAGDADAARDAARKHVMNTMKRLESADVESGGIRKTARTVASSR